MDIIKAIGKVHIKVTDSSGKIKFDKYLGENIITNAGKAAMAGLVGNTGAITAFSYIALGTSSTAVAATDTTLGTELSTSGLSRTAATISRTTTSVTNDTLNFVFTFTATGSQTIQEAGIFNAASTGTMLSHKLTGAISVVNTDQLTVTYTIQFS